MQPPSPSEIQVNLKVKNGKIASLMVGGGAKLIQEIEVNVD
jgi:hypothetical protein